MQAAFVTYFILTNYCLPGLVPCKWELLTYEMHPRTMEQCRLLQTEIESVNQNIPGNMRVTCSETQPMDH